VEEPLVDHAPVTEAPASPAASPVPTPVLPELKLTLPPRVVTPRPAVSDDPPGAEGSTPDLPRIPAPEIPPVTKRPDDETDPVAKAMAFHRLTAERAAAGLGPSTRPPTRRRRWPARVALLVVVVALTAPVVYAFRDSDAIRRVTGEGYDTSIMSIRAAPRPDDPTVVVRSTSVSDVGAGEVTVERTTTIDRDAGLAFSEGTATTDGADGSVFETLTDGERTWTRRRDGDDWSPWARDTESRMAEQLAPDAVPMYQDVVDLALRDLGPVEIATVAGIVGDELTVLRFEFRLEQAYDVAPSVAVDYLGRIVPGTTGNVTVEIGLDDRDIVRTFLLEVEPDDRSTYRNVLRYEFDTVVSAEAPDTALPSVADVVADASTTEVGP
jgi:hypothetical protein